MALRVLTRIGALLLIIGVLVQAEEVIYKAVGQTITLVPSPYTGSPSEINWKVNGDKLVDMELSPLATLFYRLQDRATIETNGRLTITNLTKGDSALYKAEVLLNNIIHETIINLIVLDLLAKPTITNKTIDEKTIELTCNSATPNVKYEWWNKTSILSEQQSYNASRSTEDVTLTCVVYNEVTRINSTTIITRLLHQPGLSGGVIAVIVILVLVLPFIPIVILLKCFPDHPWAVQVRNCLPCLTCCISKKTNVEPDGDGTGGETADKPLIDNTRGGSGNDVESGNAVSESCASVSLNVLPVMNARSMKLWKDGVIFLSAALGPPGIMSLDVTVDKVEDPMDYTATAIRANRKSCVCTIKGGSGRYEVKGTADPADIWWSIGDEKVRLFVTNTEDGQTIDLKKDGKIRYHLTFRGQRVQINDLILEPKSVTIKNLKPKDSGTYKVDVNSTDNRTTINTFTLKANQLPTGSPDKRTIELTVKREMIPIPKVLSGGEPIGNIAFHPINITNVASITWKKDNKPVDTKGKKFEVGEQGDLVINDVTSADVGSYTVHSEGQTLEQEFILRL